MFPGAVVGGIIGIGIGYGFRVGWGAKGCVW